MGLLILVIVIGTSIWVLFDAQKIGIKRKKGDAGAFLWFLFCLLFWIVAFPLYLIRRGASFKKCPFCAEDIKTEAMVCKYCGSNLMTMEELGKHKENKTKEDIINLSKKEAQRLRKSEILKVFVKDDLWCCPSCYEINRALQDACWKCGQEVEKQKE